MKVPFTWKVTGWFMIGWSAEFEVGDVKALKYFGAHIGHGGKVVGDCVECPFHGWRWGPDGTNRYIPYQPDIFWKFPQSETNPGAYYRPYPEFSSRADAIPVHPQVVAENGPDSSHFCGLGFATSAFEGSSNHRLIFACTPVDDEVSDMFYSIWWPKIPGETSDVPPEDVRAKVERQFLKTVWEDCDIWRYQKYVERPSLSKVDAKSYMAMRKWATQFYDVPPVGAPDGSVSTPDGAVPRA